MSRKKQIEKIPETSTSAIIISSVIVWGFEVAETNTGDVVNNTTEKALKH